MTERLTDDELNLLASDLGKTHADYHGMVRRAALELRERRAAEKATEPEIEVTEEPEK